jgi:hypothetical protein
MKGFAGVRQIRNLRIIQGFAHCFAHSMRAAMGGSEHFREDLTMSKKVLVVDTIMGLEVHFYKPAPPLPPFWPAPQIPTRIETHKKLIEQAADCLAQARALYQLDVETMQTFGRSDLDIVRKWGPEIRRVVELRQSMDRWSPS